MIDDQGGRRWLVDPPVGPGEIAIHIVGSDGTGLTAEQEAALGALLQTLEAADPEVVGHGKGCPKLNICLDLSCTKVTCSLQCSGLAMKDMGAMGQWTVAGSFQI